MSIKSNVRAALAALPGNRILTAGDVAAAINGDGEPQVTYEQTGRALREIAADQPKYVRRHGRGGFRIRGRRTPQR